jgi:hypothetical protein
MAFRNLSRIAALIFTFTQIASTSPSLVFR